MVLLIVDLINDMSNIWSLPLAPTHRDMCPSNIDCRLCHSSQSCPLFCGNIVPLQMRRWCMESEKAAVNQLPTRCDTV
jgi:hypothetical protein